MYLPYNNTSIKTIQNALLIFNPHSIYAFKLTKSRPPCAIFKTDWPFFLLIRVAMATINQYDRSFLMGLHVIRKEEVFQQWIQYTIPKSTISLFCSHHFTMALWLIALVSQQWNQQGIINNQSFLRIVLFSDLFLILLYHS